MNNLINTDNNYNTTKHEMNMIQTTTVQYRQQLYNTDNNSTIPLNMRGT